jgi:hypothetical protein
MKPFTASVLILLAAATAFSQAVDLQVLKRAQRLNNQNNPNAASQRAPASAAPVQAAAVQDPEQAVILQNIASLQKDFADLKSDPAMKQRLTEDLTASSRGAKPSKTTISRLADDLMEALAGKTLAKANQARLTRDLNGIANNSRLSPVQQQAIFDDVQSILVDTGVPFDVTKRVVKDVQKIARETR